jgi:hypothetical protein
MEEGTRMAKPIVVIETSEIIEGKRPELETAIHELAAFVESNEPRPISYNVFLTQVGMRMTVVQVHPDSASMAFHVDVAGPEFAKIRRAHQAVDNGCLRRTERPPRGADPPGGPAVGNATASVHDFHTGFDRFGPR